MALKAWKPVTVKKIKEFGDKKGFIILIQIIIKYLFCIWLPSKEIFVDMVETLGDQCPLYTTIKNWVAEFNRGRSKLNCNIYSDGKQKKHLKYFHCQRARCQPIYVKHHRQ